MNNASGKIKPESCVFSIWDHSTGFKFKICAIVLRIQCHVHSTFSDCSVHWTFQGHKEHSLWLGKNLIWRGFTLTSFSWLWFIFNVFGDRDRSYNENVYFPFGMRLVLAFRYYSLTCFFRRRNLYLPVCITQKSKVSGYHLRQWNNQCYCVDCI